MAKKIILAAVTMVAVCLALLIYHQTTKKHQPAESSSPPARTDIPTSVSDPGDFIDTGRKIAVGKAEKIHLKTRDENGKLVREFGFAERLSTAQETIEVSQPWIKFHLKNKNIIEITALTGSLPKLPAGKIQEPTRGILNNVRIIMYKIPREPSQKLLMDIEMNGRVTYEREYSRLSSPGTVKITSPQFNALGSNLTFQYDQIKEQLQELVLRSVDYLLVPASFLDQKEKKKQNHSSAPSESSGSSTTAPKSQPVKKKKITSYIFSLNDNVVITNQKDEITYADDFIRILADIDRSESLTTDPNHPALTPKKTLPLEHTPDDNYPEDKEPDVISPAPPELKITCDGPLRIIAQDEKVPPSRENRLIVTARGNPVRSYRNGILSLAADQVFYDQNRQIKLTALDHPVRLHLPPHQWVTAERDVTLDQKNGLATLRGPGDIQYTLADPNQPGNISYLDQLKIKFDPNAHFSPSLTSLTDMPLEWFDFVGGMNVQEKNSLTNLKKGRLSFFPSPAPEKSRKKYYNLQLKSIELTDNISFLSDTSSFSAEQLTARFQLDPNGVSQPHSILARKNVQFEDPNYIVEAADQLFIAFQPSKNRKTAIPAKTAHGSPELSGISFKNLFGLNQIRYVLAEGIGGNVRLVDKNDQYEIKGDRALGNPAQKTWSIQGNPARVLGLDPQAQFKELTGNIIEARLQEPNSHFAIPGPGKINLISQADFTGNTSAEPKPLHINWENGAAYQTKNNQIIINHVTVNMDQKYPDKNQHTILTCPQLEVHLDPRNTKKNNDLVDKKFKTLIAHGPDVLLIDRQINPLTNDPNDLFTEMVIRTDNLYFDNESRSLQAPGKGWIQIVNHKQSSSKSDDKDSTTLDNVLSNTLGSSGPNYTLLQYNELMTFEPDPNRLDLRLRGNVTLYHLPTENLPSEFSTQQLSKLEGWRRLDCRKLHVRMNQKNQPQNFNASGNVYFETIIKSRQHLITAASVSYDEKKNILIFRGTPSMPVRFNQMTEFSEFKFNPKTGSATGTPFKP